MIKLNKKLENIIISLLTQKEYLRDSDNLLQQAIWFLQCKQRNIVLKDLSVIDFFKMQNESLLYNSESIRRTRQRIQEKRVELRGRSYRFRKSKSSDIKQILKGSKV
jgi:hypothetical protein